MLMRTDPFRDLDRLTQQVLGSHGTLARPSVMPMDAWRDGDVLHVEFDLPGVTPDSCSPSRSRSLRRPSRARSPSPAMARTDRSSTPERKATVMEPTCASRSDPARTSDEEFLALIYADEQLLRAEFDAIIAAEWPTPPPNRPHDTTLGWRAPSGRSARRSGARPSGLPDQPGRPRVEAWSQVRSPPYHRISNRRQKGR
jgi:hypothetical protein